MSQEPRKTSWWGTVPGMLTAAAGVITAVTGLLIALDQIGFFRADPEPVSATAAALEPAPGSAPSGVGVPAGSAQGAGAAGAIQAGKT